MTPTTDRPFYLLIVGNLLIVMAVFAIAGVVSYRSLNAQYLQEIEAYQYQLTRIAQQYVERLWPLPDAEIDRLCKQFAAESPAHAATPDATAPPPGLPVRLTVIAADGRVLGDSQADPAKMINHKGPDRPEVLRALEGHTGENTHQSGTLTTPYRYVAMPVTHKEQVVGAVRVAMPVVAISHAQDVIRDTIVWTSVMAVIAFALVALLVNWAWYAKGKRGRRTTAADGRA